MKTQIETVNQSTEPKFDTKLSIFISDPKG